MDIDQLKSLADEMKATWIGGLGGGLGFLYAVTENERAFRWGLFALFVAFGSVAANALDAWMDPEFRGRAVALFFAGSIGYYLYGVARERGREWMLKVKLPLPGSMNGENER